VNYVYATFDEDECDVLTYAERYQPDFFGAIFCIVGEWYKRGCPEDTEARKAHDFKEWAGSLSYIVSEIMGEPDMFEGYEAVRERLYNPNMIWVRKTALALLQTEAPLEPMTTQQLLEMLEYYDLAEFIPGLKDGEGIDDSRHLKKALRTTGRMFGDLFKGRDQINIEDLVIRKDTERVKRDDGKGYREHSVYSFAKVKAA
jgi:hypothetical protein